MTSLNLTTARLISIFVPLVDRERDRVKEVQRLTFWQIPKLPYRRHSPSKPFPVPPTLPSPISSRSQKPTLKSKNTTSTSTCLLGVSTLGLVKLARVLSWAMFDTLPCQRSPSLEGREVTGRRLTHLFRDGFLHLEQSIQPSVLDPLQQSRRNVHVSVQRSFPRRQLRQRGNRRFEGSSVRTQITKQLPPQRTKHSSQFLLSTQPEKKGRKRVAEKTHI